MSSAKDIPLRVAVWKFSAAEFAVVKIWRGPQWQRVGDIHPTEARAREAARFIPRKHPLIGLNDLSTMGEGEGAAVVRPRHPSTVIGE